MEDILLLRHLTLCISAASFLQPFPPCPSSGSFRQCQDWAACSYSSQQDKAGITHIPNSYLHAYSVHWGKGVWRRLLVSFWRLYYSSNNVKVKDFAEAFATSATLKSSVSHQLVHVDQMKNIWMECVIERSVFYLYFILCCLVEWLLNGRISHSTSASSESEKAAIIPLPHSAGSTSFSWLLLSIKSRLSGSRWD